MRKPIAAFLLVAGLSSATEARAQYIVGGRAAYSTTTYSAPAAPSYPYSYYAALPNPARGYVSYGSNDFPFYGVPYGRPYDPWTWPYMSGAYNRGLARYYDPPVK